MKWIKTQNGNIIRLGAISEFVPNNLEMSIVIGTTNEVGWKYTNQRQADNVYRDLLNFIKHADADEIFVVPPTNEYMWLQDYPVSEIGDIGVRTYNALARADIRTVFDLMPVYGIEISIRNVGMKEMGKLRTMRDDFIAKKLEERL